MNRPLRCAAAALAAAACLLASSARAAGPVVLTLEQALTLADAQNRDIAKAREYQRWVRGKFVEERSAALPSLALTATGGRQHDSAQSALFMNLFPPDQDAQSAVITLNQTLFSWGKVGSAIKAAKAGLASADDQLDLFRQAARRDVTAAFYDVLLAKELAAIARQTVEQRERHLDEARKRHAAGTATDYDVLAAEVAVQNARPDAIRAANTVSTTREALRLLLALEKDEVDVTGGLDASPEAPPAIDGAVATAIEHRPDLAALGHKREAYKQLVKIAAAGDKPRLDLSGSYGHRWISAGDLTANGKTWSAALTLSFPFFDGLASHGRAIQAKSDYETLRLDEAKLRDAVALEVRNAVHAVEESGQVVAALGGTVKQAERMLTMAEKGFELGVGNRLDVQDAQLNLAAARANLARAGRDYLVARATLLWAQGLL